MRPLLFRFDCRPFKRVNFMASLRQTVSTLWNRFQHSSTWTAFLNSRFVQSCPDFIKIILLQDKFMFGELMKRARDSKKGYAEASLGPLHFMTLTNKTMVEKAVQYGDPHFYDPKSFDPEARKPFEDVRAFFKVSTLPNETGDHIIHERKLIKDYFAPEHTIAPAHQIFNTIFKNAAQQPEVVLDESIDLACTQILAQVWFNIPPEYITKELVALLKKAEHVVFNRNDTPAHEFEALSRAIKAKNDEIIRANEARIKSSKHYLRYLFEEKKIAPTLEDTNGIFGLVVVGNIVALLTETILQIATTPELALKLRDALSAVGEIQPTEQDYEKLDNNLIIHQFYLESLRYFSPAGPVVRYASKAGRLGDASDENSVAIRPRTYLFVSPRAIAHDPRYWPEPNRYNPDRFEPSSISKMNQHLGINEPNHYPFIPFSTGARICPASHDFAKMLFKIGIYQIFSQHQLSLKSPTLLETIPEFTKEPRLQETYRVVLQPKQPEAKADGLRRSERLRSKNGALDQQQVKPVVFSSMQSDIKHPLAGEPSTSFSAGERVGTSITTCARAGVIPKGLLIRNNMKIF